MIMSACPIYSYWSKTKKIAAAYTKGTYCSANIWCVKILWVFVITVTANIYAIQASILQQIAMSQLNRVNVKHRTCISYWLSTDFTQVHLSLNTELHISCHTIWWKSELFTDDTGISIAPLTVTADRSPGAIQAYFYPAIIIPTSQMYRSMVTGC